MFVGYDTFDHGIFDGVLYLTYGSRRSKTEGGHYFFAGDRGLEEAQVVAFVDIGHFLKHVLEIGQMAAYFLLIARGYVCSAQ